MNIDAPENIVHVNLSKRLATTESGEIVPVVHMFDDDGEETNDVAECAAFVAGPTSYGMWLVDKTASFTFGGVFH